ncbi:hypothetical protein [Jeongeupia sp. USM3]|uniref:hypothetical protein n=1 Tax=Jeongeupia sp. USM3 TaxID=1906741 RepID=UPI00089DF400|nr:hypothetical protein [Jeongeupia sp. USM3]AOX99359.1 hypothetical protein BJP62_02145 [Jeongeupia sp. USM3]
MLVVIAVCAALYGAVQFRLDDGRLGPVDGMKERIAAQISKVVADKTPPQTAHPPVAAGGLGADDNGQQYVYKCADARGAITYQQNPCGRGSRLVYQKPISDFPATADRSANPSRIQSAQPQGDPQVVVARGPDPIECKRLRQVYSRNWAENKLKDCPYCKRVMMDASEKMLSMGCPPING